MFKDTEIAEVMVGEIGEVRSGQRRTMVVPMEEGGAKVVSVMYLRRSDSTSGLTTPRDINVFDMPKSLKHCSDGSQVPNAY